MATTAKNLKGFYKQTKSNITGGISKSKPSSRKVAPKHAAAQGSDVTQPAALISHGSVDLNGTAFIFFVNCNLLGFSFY